MTDPYYALGLIKKLADTVEEYCVINEGWDHLSPLVAEARAYLEGQPPAPAKEPRPNRLVVGDIWEFETDVKVKGKRKLQTVTLQWEVKGFHYGECAWQLESLDGEHYIYLWEHAPQYEEMTYIGTKSND
jgi:hypothetical protein